MWWSPLIMLLSPDEVVINTLFSYNQITLTASSGDNKKISSEHHIIWWSQDEVVSTRWTSDNRMIWLAPGNVVLTTSSGDNNIISGDHHIN